MDTLIPTGDGQTFMTHIFFVVCTPYLMVAEKPPMLLEVMTHLQTWWRLISMGVDVVGGVS